MLFNITIIGNSGRPLAAGDVDQFAEKLRKLGCSINGQEWLSPGEACDVFAEGDLETTRKEMAAWAESQKLDVIVQNYQGRRKKVFLADMESTIIEQEMLDELADLIGIRSQVEEITRRAMFGELDFRAALTERLALLKDLDASKVYGLVNKITLMPGAKELVGTLKKFGVRCILVSGGFNIFIEHVAKKLKFDEFYGNVLAIRDNRLMGVVVDPVLGPEAKLARLNTTINNMRVSSGDVCAVGDGANDIPMIAAAGLGIAFRAKPVVNEKATHLLRFADLRGVLFAQGYRKEEMAV
jgi:phosphoserine phosphatase